MNAEKTSCEFISTNLWLRILMVKEIDYVIYRVITLHTDERKTNPVVVLLWYRDKYKISLHREGQKAHIIYGVDLKEETAQVECILYHSHSMCSLEVVQQQAPAVETCVDHAAMWSLHPQYALKFIIYCIARDIGRTKIDDAKVSKAVSVFSPFPMRLADPRENKHNGEKTLAFCTRYDGYHATSYFYARDNGQKWSSVDEEIIVSKGACFEVLDVYTGIGMPTSNGRAPLVKIFGKQTSGLIHGKFAHTQSVRKLLLEMPDELFADVCAATPFCCVQESTNPEDRHIRLMLCLASRPNDDYIELRLTLHRFMKANISRSLNACIEAVLA